jgi:Inner centromere protein, ARK binding region
LETQSLKPFNFSNDNIAKSLDKTPVKLDASLNKNFVAVEEKVHLSGSRKRPRDEGVDSKSGTNKSPSLSNVVAEDITSLNVRKSLSVSKSTKKSMEERSGNEIVQAIVAPKKSVDKTENSSLQDRDSNENSTFQNRDSIVKQAVTAKAPAASPKQSVGVQPASSNTQLSTSGDAVRDKKANLLAIAKARLLGLASKVGANFNEGPASNSDDAEKRSSALPNPVVTSDNRISESNHQNAFLKEREDAKMKLRAEIDAKRAAAAAAQKLSPKQKSSIVTSHAPVSVSTPTITSEMSAKAVTAVESRISKVEPPAPSSGNKKAAAAVVSSTATVEPLSISKTATSFDHLIPFQSSAIKKGQFNPKSQEDNYDMSDREDNSDDDDEDDANNKDIPAWAKGPALENAIRAQFGASQKKNPDLLFGEVNTCNLEEIFQAKKKRYMNRSSSGNWVGDKLTQEEVLKYAADMGHH